MNLFHTVNKLMKFQYYSPQLPYHLDHVHPYSTLQSGMQNYISYYLNITLFTTRW